MLRRVVVVLAGPLVLVSMLVFGCAPALAGTGFASSPLFAFAPPDGFETPVGLAVNDSLGLFRDDVYVSDQGHNAVDEFSASGAFLQGAEVPGAAPDQLAVDNYAGGLEGDVYVAGFGSDVVYRFSPGLSLEKEVKGFDEPIAVAVDEHGDLFVMENAGNAANARVLEFNATGEPVNATGVYAGDNAVLEGLLSARGLAVSANGEELYVATSAGAFQYTISGGRYVQSATVDPGYAPGVALTPSGNVLVDQGTEVSEYEPGNAVASSQFGRETLSGGAIGLGVGESGDAYVTDSNANVVDVFEAGETPAAPSTGATSAVGGSAAVLEGTLNTGEGGATGYYFAYNVGESCHGGGGTTPGEATGGVVHSEAVDLEPLTRYTFCLVATNKYGSASGGEVSFETGSEPPAVEGGSASAVTSTSAILTAQVNPNGMDTHYYFQYGMSTSYGSSAPAQPGTDIGSGRSAQQVSVTLGGLRPETTYHYRVDAVDAAGEESDGTDETFTTFGAASQFALPDGRVYEQATPVEKNGVNAGGQIEVVQAATDGEAITFAPTGTFSGDEGTANLPAYVSRRDPGGWTTRGLLPPASAGEHSFVLGWSPDLSEIFTQDAGETSSDTTLYMQDRTVGSLQKLALDNEHGGFFLADVTPDGSRVLFESNDKLAPGAVAGEWNVYEWDRTTGTVSLQGVLPGPDGSGPPGGSFAGPGNTSKGGAYAQFYTENTISEDGSRVFFTAGGTGQIYVREDGTTTVPVSGAVSLEPALFDAATPDGAYVFFTVEGSLYRFDVASQQAVLIHSGGVEGVVGVSNDGTYAYFAADGRNVYMWHEGSVSFIAQLPGQIPSLEGRFIGETVNWASAAAGITRPEKIGWVSPDGRTALLFSAQQLTSYDNDGFGELYRYYAPSGKLDCVSCDPTGAAPVASAAVQQVQEYAFSRQEDSQASTYVKIQTRNLADDGRRVFFETRDALVPQDTNGVLDVYEWEADGTGSCESESQDGGCIYLISTGRSPEASYFADASESGNDVFFFTGQSLVAQDQDQLVDVYDARVGGGIASQNTPTPPPPCAGEACRPPAAGASVEPISTSVGFSGPGNPPPPAAVAHPATRTLTRGQKLAAALRVCRKKPKRKRAACEKQAHRRFGATVSSTRGGSR